MRKHILKRCICFTVVFLLLSGCIGKTESETETEQPSNVIAGNSPEEIIQTFLDAFAEQNVDTMLSSCYSDEMVNRFSFPDYVKQTGAFSASANMGSVNSQFYRDLALAERKSELAKNIRLFTWSILLAEDEKWLDDYGEIDFVRPKTHIDNEWAKEFESKVNSNQIQDFRVLSIDENNPDQQHSEGAQNRALRYGTIYGVDDICERAVLFECNGKLFYKGFTLVQYDGQWQIMSLSAAMLGESSLGTASLIENESDYRSVIA